MPALLVHGNPDTSRLWEEVLPHLDGYGEDVEFIGRSKGEQNRHGIVLAGVGVDYDLVFHWLPPRGPEFFRHGFIEDRRIGVDAFGG